MGRTISADLFTIGRLPLVAEYGVTCRREGSATAPAALAACRSTKRGSVWREQTQELWWKEVLTPSKGHDVRPQCT